MALSNYELMRNQMRGEFIKYDQTKMIEKFGLAHDEAYLYLDFVGRPYRISRKTGKVEWSADGVATWTEADYNESMTIYDVFAARKTIAGCREISVPCMEQRAQPKPFPLEAAFSEIGEFFQGRTKQLHQACGRLGEPADMAGDVAAVLRAFSFLPVVLQFWEGDEEFSPNLKFMVDENILDYMHFETVFFMLSHIVKRLEELMAEEDAAY